MCTATDRGRCGRGRLAWALVTALVAGWCGAQEAAEVPKELQAEPDVEILQVRPLATMNGVRIQVDLKLKEVRPALRMGLLAEIVEWPGGKRVWEGSCGIADFRQRWDATVERVVPDLDVKPWSPAAPHLYQVNVLAGTKAQGQARFGFRSVEARDGRLLLNGRPLFLRGNAINPPGRGMQESVVTNRAFAEAYIRDLKAHNINCIRTSSGTWLDVCDELGMLVIGGNYDAPPGSSVNSEGHTIPPLNIREAVDTYKNLIFKYHARHPSVIIYVLANEMPNTGYYGELFDTFLDTIHAALSKWDPTRLYLTNSGLGGGRTGDLIDWHSYVGWYSGNFLSYYLLRTRSAGEFAHKPTFFSESIGAYTEAEGRFRVGGRQLPAALAWAGHAADAAGAAQSYQVYLTAQTIEICRRVARVNPTLNGLLSSSNPFRFWEGVSRYDEMAPNPTLRQMSVSFQPVLLSLESWTPQVYAGSKVRVRAHVLNDSDDGRDLMGNRVAYRLVSAAGEAVVTGAVAVGDIPHGGAACEPIVFDVPPRLAEGDYRLCAEVTAGEARLGSNVVSYFVAPPAWSAPRMPPEMPVQLYDKEGIAAASILRLGLPVVAVRDLRQLTPGGCLVIAPEMWDETLEAGVPVLRAFVKGGGRVLLLRQPPETNAYAWLPVSLGVYGRSDKGDVAAPGMWINIQRPGHPVFEGIGRERLRLWSDASGWNETREGHPNIYPARMGFELKRPEDLARTAVLANFGSGLAAIALCEVFDGRGSIVVSGLDMVSRAAVDPVADRVLAQLVCYVATRQGHEAMPLVDASIEWGRYATEGGVVVGPVNGFLEHVESKRVMREGGSTNVYAQQTHCAGRRPCGPFSYTTEGNGVAMLDDGPVGEATFFARIPVDRQVLVTELWNPDTNRTASFTVVVNGQTNAAASVAAGAESTVRTPLPGGARELGVVYRGERFLVVRRSRFE